MKQIIPCVFIMVFGSQVNAQKSDIYKNDGFFNITRLSYIDVRNVVFDGFGTGESNLANESSKAYSLQTINGYFLTPHLSLGAGFGLDGYHDPTYNTMPLFIDIRGYFVNNKNSVFTFLDVGTLLKPGTSFRKGRMMEIGIGYKFFASSNIAMIGSINGSFKGLSLTEEPYISSNRTVALKGIGFSVGLIF